MPSTIGTVSSSYRSSVSGGSQSDVVVDGRNYRVHRFTASEVFRTNRPLRNVEYLVVAGGGSGGSIRTSVETSFGMGGGGSGGLLLGTLSEIPSGSWPVVVGAGGARQAGFTPGTSGTGSSFYTVVSAGGGRGSHLDGAPSPGTSGGSGGGGSLATYVENENVIQIGGLSVGGSFIDPTMVTTTQGGSTSDNFNDLVKTGDGSYIVVGDFARVNDDTDYENIVKLNPDGSPVGFSSFPIELSGTLVNSVDLDSDENILVGGTFTSTRFNGSSNFTTVRIARLFPNGAPDLSFSANCNANSDVLEVRAQSDGRVVLAGAFTSVKGVARNRLARVNPDGTLDSSLNFNVNNSVWTITNQPDGKFLVGGGFTSFGVATRNYIARVHPNGALDSGFSANLNNGVEAIRILPNERMVVGGKFSSLDGSTANRIVVLNPDGKRDTTFSASITGGNVWSIDRLSDGRYLVGGDFTTVNGQGTYSRVVILHPDGSIDTSFTPPSNQMPNALVMQVKVDSDNKPLIIGSFKSPRESLIRYNLTSEQQGNNGGSGGVYLGDIGRDTAGGGGGGGRGLPGGDAYFIGFINYGGDGGVGLASDITGTSTYYAGGGGGGVNGVGGLGGGGNGGNYNLIPGSQINGSPGQNAAVNTGGGGGGATGGSNNILFNFSYGGNGGSGVVVIRYEV